jgi:hypothetical protein
MRHYYVIADRIILKEVKTNVVSVSLHEATLVDVQSIIFYIARRPQNYAAV